MEIADIGNRNKKNKLGLFCSELGFGVFLKVVDMHVKFNCSFGNLLVISNCLSNYIKKTNCLCNF